MIKRINILDPITDEPVDTIPIRISYIVLKKTQTKTKKLLTQATETDFDLYEELLWQAYEEGSKAVDEKKKYERKELDSLMDSCYYEFVATIPEFFPKQKPYPQQSGKKRK